MAYRSTVHGTSGYSPFFLLHGREIILPTTQSLRAKLSPEVEATEHAHKLRTLKSRLRTADKIVRENARKSREKNRRYYDAKAQARSFNSGDVIYLYNPAVKPGHSAKFHKFWTGPYLITARKSALNYEIESTTGKRSVVHVNRMKKAHNTAVWRKESPRKRQGKSRRQIEDEEEGVNYSPGPITVPNPQARSPRRIASPTIDTPETELPHGVPPNSQNRDPNYEPSSSPRSRFELRTTRNSPPVTRLRSRLLTSEDEANHDSV
jgi:hypothetical protein